MGILLPAPCDIALAGWWLRGWVLDSLQTSSALVQALTLDVPIQITATSLFLNKKEKLCSL